MKRCNATKTIASLLLLTAVPAVGGVIGEFTVNYRFNAAGCPDGYPGSITPQSGNPYFCGSIPPGPIHIDLDPGSYKLTVLEFGPEGAFHPRIWIGDEKVGFRIDLPLWDVGEAFAFRNTSTNVSLYAWDWYSGDNSSDLWVRVELSSVPEPGTMMLLATALSILAIMARRRCSRQSRRALVVGDLRS